MRSHPVHLTLFALVAFGLIGPALGQRPEDGEIDFEKKIRASSEMRKDLRKGDVSANPKEKAHVEAINDTARMLVYPLYWRTVSKPEVGKVNAVVDDFVSNLATYQRGRPATNTFIQLLCKEVITCCVEIIQHRDAKTIAGINAARILATIPQRHLERNGALQSEKTWIEETQPRLADGNAELLAETCLTLIADTKMTDGHRYWLYRCLASLLSLPAQTPPLLKAETVGKILVKAIEQVEKKVVFPKATSRQEVEGYKMLRQQAILVLASAGRPVVGDKRPILVLARVAGGDTDLAPAPRLTERIEATIGLARMGAASAKLADIQMDYAMGAIVSTVIEFGRQGNGNRAEPPIKRLRPWKVDAARLNEALDELKASVKAPRYVQDAIKECQSKVLSDLEKDNNLSKFNELNDWLTSNVPPSKALFKSDPTTTIKGAAAAPE